MKLTVDQTDSMKYVLPEIYISLMIDLLGPCISSNTIHGRWMRPEWDKVIQIIILALWSHNVELKFWLQVPPSTNFVILGQLFTLSDP